MSPRMVDKDEKQARIVREALKLFSKKGYAAASVREIAEKAGIGKGTIYEYFNTKADLFLAATRYWMDGFETRFSDRLSEIDDPAGQLTAIAHAFVELVDPLDPGTARMSVEVIRQGILEDGVLFNRRFEIQEMMVGIQRLVEQVLLDGVSKGVFSPQVAGCAGKIAVNLHGYLDGILLHSVMTKRHFDLKAHVDFYMQSLVQGLSDSRVQKPAA